MIAIDFADLSDGIYGSLRGNEGILQFGDQQVALSALEISERGVRGPHGLHLELEQLLGPALFGDGTQEWLCAVRGVANARPIDCLGSIGQGSPAGRGVAAWVDQQLAFSARAQARYPEGDELEAWVLRTEGSAPVDDPRLTTAYDASGVHNRAGLELWEAQESEFPLRLAGELVAMLELERARCAFMLWHFEGSVCAGRYEIAR